MKHPMGSTRHLLYWQKVWFKRFFLTWYHIFNRKAYWKWKNARTMSRKNKTLLRTIITGDRRHMDFGDFDLDEQDHQQEFCGDR